MFETLPQIRAAVMTGLSRPEIEGLLGRRLESDEVMEFNKTKAVLKLREADKEKREEQQAKPPALLQEGITPNLRPKLPPLKERYAKEQIEACIEKHYGVVTRICNELDCTYS